MDYAQAQDAFFAPRKQVERQLDWSTPARALRDAIEPIATICFWSEPAYNAYNGLGLDFLQGYIYSRGAVLGDAVPQVVSSSFGVFEPGLVADTFAAGRGICSIDEVLAAKERGSIQALRECLDGEPDGLDDVVAVLRRGTEAADPVGRPLHAGWAALDWANDPLGQLWHACSTLREYRGDGHLAALVTHGIDGVQANQLTELWVGYESGEYTGSRAWDEDRMADALDGLRERGLVEGEALSAAGLQLREDLEATTDASVQPAIEAIGADLDDVVKQLDDWGGRIVERGWFPPDPYKRAAG